jgi:OmpA-OmpF porin, OOP family
MKKIILSFIIMAISILSFGQANFKKLPSLGVHLMMNDFQTPAEIRSKGLDNVLREKQYYKLDRLNVGLAVSYLEGLGKHLDFSGTFAASFVNYPVPDRPLRSDKLALLEAFATGNLKLLTDNYFLNPFMTLGVGASKFKGYFSAYIPTGLGLQVKLHEDNFLLFNAQYRIPVTEFAEYHLYYSAGYAGPLTDRKIVEAPPVVVVPVVVDKDGDGVPDADDKCPDVPGVAALSGCPDRDADGITDADDKCPETAGLAKYNGCPIPDTDADGINDEQDKCPSEKGFARYQGCPIPDSDADGINDEEDKCPNKAGTAANMGCPEISKEVIEKISYAAKNVFFATGSAKLLPKSFKSLDEIATILAKDESLLMDVDGHTDDQGKDDANLLLSQNRANAVKAYLVSKGVADARLKSTGYGEAKPVADNKTAAGRAKNRRVEMTVKNY